MIQSIISGWFLRWNNPKKEIQKSAKRAVSTYHRVSKKVYWYPESTSSVIHSIDDFKRDVPILTKQVVFENNTFGALVNNQFNRLGSVLMSSGSSGRFSLGVMSKREMKRAALETDIFLNLLFNAQKGQTYLINASAMGVRAFTNHLCSDTGPRTDIVIGLLKSVAIHFDKVFIIGDPVFIKLMVEESLEADVDWTNMNAFFISGGEWLPETLRSYVHKLTKKDARKPENGYWSSIYGLTELGYPIFFETVDLVAFRSHFCRNKSDFSLSFRNQTRCTTPLLFHYRCSSYFIEEKEQDDGASHLIFTTLDKRKVIPLIRYDTCDVGSLIDEDNVADSKFNLPLVSFFGRDYNYLELSDCKVYVTDIKELLFDEFELNPMITGYFTLNRKNEKVLLDVQLKEGITINDVLYNVFFNSLQDVYPQCIDLKFSAYHEISQQMKLDFERKFNHLKPDCNE